MFSAGDLITLKRGADWSALKILAMDTWPDGTASAHCLVYASMPTRPTLESVRDAEVQVWHAPINAQSFIAENWEKIGNVTPTSDELVGFIEYLKLTDFSRYLEVTGQDVKALVGQARQHYLNANDLCEKGQREEGIAEYSIAIDLFPLFYEAIDNRAFTYMELGRFDAALADFGDSLRVNPDGMAAFFSRGECLMKLGRLEEAKVVFEEGLTRFPEKRLLFSDFLQRVRSLAP